MIPDFFRFLLQLIRVALIVFGLHFLLNSFWPFPLEQSLFLKIHAFNFIASLLMYPLVVVAFRKISDKAGFAFLATSVFKMLVAMLFLVPFVLPRQEYSQNFALQFTVIFVLYMVFEVSITIRKLNE